MSPDATSGLETAFELTELGIALYGERFRREHPGCTQADVDAFIQAWLLDRSGAPNGDAEGRPVTIPRGK